MKSYRDNSSVLSGQVDEINISFSVDNHMADLWKNLAPHRNIFTLDTPGEVSHNIAIPKTVVASIANWLSSTKGHEISQVKRDRWEEIPCI